MKVRRPTAVIDIDGVIAVPNYEWDYANSVPIEKGIRMVQRLRREEIAIVLHTARWEEDRSVTADWLKTHEVPYDELVLGKPSGDVYVDDRNWPEPFDPERSIGFIDYLVDEVRRRHAEHHDLVNRDK